MNIYIYQSIDKLAEVAISRYSIPRVSKLSVASPDRLATGVPAGWNEGGQSWYAGPETAAALISATRRVRCTLRVADRIIDRWMDGVGKGKRARPASVPPRPAVPLSLFLLPRVPSPTPLAVLFRSCLSHSLSRGSPRFLPLSRFRYLLPPPSFPGFRYLIKSSYDEKDEDSARSGRIRRSFSIPFYGPLKRPCSREKNWGMIMRGR